MSGHPQDTDPPAGAPQGSSAAASDSEASSEYHDVDDRLLPHEQADMMAVLAGSGENEDEDEDDEDYDPAWLNAPVSHEHEDDIIDFVDAEEGDEDEEDEEEDEDDEDDDDMGGLNFEVMVGDDGDEDGDDDGIEFQGTLPLLTILQAARSGHWSRNQILSLLGDPEQLAADIDNEDDPSPLSQILRRGRRQPKDPNRFPKVPSVEGEKLMRSGVFGSNERAYDRRMRKQVSRRILDRELGTVDYDARRRNNGLLAQSLLPTTQAENIIHYDDPVYSGQFSDDGNFFYSVCQDFNVRMYDTSNPYNWKHYKSVHYPWGQWTLTDASLSPDNKWLAYTSISPLVCIAPTDPLDTGDPYNLDLSEDHQARRGNWGRPGGFTGIFSVRFSGDGRELVAGTNGDSLVVYDIESRRVLHHIEGHSNDVNAVCFADKSSPHIIYSGSDDATVKVWDRRSMGDKREVGAFVGHVEGITYIDSKGDGRYILSNGKDQSMKLWDLRMVMSRRQFRELDPMRHTRYSSYDYRMGRYDEEDWDPHPHDNSVVTFRGHKVLNTLIRCHFSPPNATNSRYVYSGSRDGKVYVWNMDATLARVIDVQKATKNSRERDGGRARRYYRFDDGGSWSTCVRDASWHPNAPFLVASAWNGYSLARGTCSLHSFNEGLNDEGDPPMSRNYDPKMREPDWEETY